MKKGTCALNTDNHTLIGISAIVQHYRWSHHNTGEASSQ